MHSSHCGNVTFLAMLQVEMQARPVEHSVNSTNPHDRYAPTSRRRNGRGRWLFTTEADSFWSSCHVDSRAFTTLSTDTCLYILPDHGIHRIHHVMDR